MKRDRYAFCLHTQIQNNNLHFTPLLNIIPEICILYLQVEQYAECTQVVTIESNSVAAVVAAAAVAALVQCDAISFECRHAHRIYLKGH